MATGQLCTRRCAAEVGAAAVALGSDAVVGMEEAPPPSVAGVAEGSGTGTP